MTLEVAYWLALGLGLGLLVLSLLLGDVFDVLPFEFGGGDFSAAPVFFTATAAFGAGGLIGQLVFEMGNASVLTGLAGAVLVGGLTAVLFAALTRQEAVETFERSKLVGMRGRATLALGPDKTGRVTVQYAGMTRSLSATSHEDIKAGEEIVVRDVVGNSLTVARPEGAPADREPQ